MTTSALFTSGVVKDT